MFTPDYMNGLMHQNAIITKIQMLKSLIFILNFYIDF